MEGKDKPGKEKDERVTNTIAKRPPNTMMREINSRPYIWHAHITVLDLNRRNITDLDHTVRLPVNLICLNLSYNKFSWVPEVILVLENLMFLDLSHNAIESFNDCPQFCHMLKILDISNNHLVCPPDWVWSQTPEALSELNLSDNIYITRAFECDSYFKQLLRYNTSVTELKIQNCRIGKYMELLHTFTHAKSICLGVDDLKAVSNYVRELPCRGLDRCIEMTRLIVTNTRIHTILPTIEMFRNLVEINLAQNYLIEIPDEFCNLKNLEICTLSLNKLQTVPYDIYKMQNLSQLYLNSNVICKLPDSLRHLNLKTLDLYDNNLHEVPLFNVFEELDLALNYFEEPNNDAYLDKREKLRSIREFRHNGRKILIESDDDYSEEECDEESNDVSDNGKEIDIPPRSPEDWDDSDSDWDAMEQGVQVIPRRRPTWGDFVRKKMAEGNFCPMDAHPVSVVERIRIQRLINPVVLNEVEGQFDDYSSDEN